MPKEEILKNLYHTSDDIDDTVKIVLDTDDEEEREFISMVSDYILQKKKK